ncbi:hypothetical protein EMIHUDRAFT_256219 [Emiliania huxleyi CCMP1516]|uniref:EF-hand domain-containing protein n=2 Tax=Emiliania huxleyi TaxID=2903 RepID=A0A0D3IY78_EMIH1|nr:hypothetical protein EMIHUDRAFT_256219 [Emiliania huxleyi CCMP1516]EOD16213.1 hypothetical protein EMIHUDRAFT_256219 [Emiliania huxleyi CCMP1516]|eukprot:XP_005768642.1 hypothetical protein EMIHUDRAFT_256219 [Emiliania huxleyi CCMP1516]
MRILHAAMDEDSDGRVTIAEGAKLVRRLRTALMLRQSAPIMQTMDTDRDGYLSAEEFQADLEHMDVKGKRTIEDSFDGFDTDRDGRLAAEEALPLFTFLLPFQKLDTDLDGRLTLSEFQKVAAERLASDERVNATEHYSYHSGIWAGIAALRELLGLADSDADGQVSADELAECRFHAKFGGSAAYHHSRDWIKVLEEAVAGLQQQQQAKAKEDRRGGQKEEL